MIASRDQNQLPSSFAPLANLLKASTFLSNLNGFNSSPSPLVQGFTQRKGSSKVWKEKCSKWFYHFLSLPLLVFVCITCVFCFIILSQSSFMLCFVLFLFIFFSVLTYFVFHIKIKKNWKIQKQCVFVYTGTCVPWTAKKTLYLL